MMGMLGLPAIVSTPALQLATVRMRGNNMSGASTTVRTTINKPRELFFYWFFSLDPPKFLHRYAIIPAVVEARNQTGPMYIQGSTREFLLSDGTTTTEEILASNPPESVYYRIINLENMFRHLVQEGNANFTFSEISSGKTQVDWQYTFTGHNWIANLILQLLVSTFWKGFMQSALTKVKRLAEEDFAIED